MGNMYMFHMPKRHPMCFGWCLGQQMASPKKSSKDVSQCARGFPPRTLAVSSSIFSCLSTSPNTDTWTIIGSRMFMLKGLQNGSCSSVKHSVYFPNRCPGNSRLISPHTHTPYLSAYPKHDTLNPILNPLHPEALNILQP